jgi:hypothetical protein
MLQCAVIVQYEKYPPGSVSLVEACWFYTGHCSKIVTLVTKDSKTLNFQDEW